MIGKYVKILNRKYFNGFTMVYDFWYYSQCFSPLLGQLLQPVVLNETIYCTQCLLPRGGGPNKQTNKQEKWRRGKSLPELRKWRYYSLLCLTLFCVQNQCVLSPILEKEGQKNV